MCIWGKVTEIIFLDILHKQMRMHFGNFCIHSYCYYSALYLQFLSVHQVLLKHIHLLIFKYMSTNYFYSKLQKPYEAVIG